tara:strand:- start:229 stop:1953 length:1725 start_codon:yes stop_codon:yes gene_type:complete
MRFKKRRFLKLQRENKQKAAMAENVLREYLREAMLMNTRVDHLASLKAPKPSPIFCEIKPHIFEHKYVTQVLGIDLPLNESYPYSAPVYKRILQEQKLLEEFFSYSDEEIYVELLKEQDEATDASPWSWTGLLRAGSDLKAAAAALKVIALDPSKIKDFVSSVWQVIQEPFDTMKQFFTTIIETGKEWGIAFMTKLGGIAEKIWGWIQAAADKVTAMSGWKQVLGIAAVALGLTYAWKNWGSFIITGMKHFNSFVDLVAKAKDYIKKESFIPAASLVGALYGDEDDSLNEFLGFGKKDKWAEKAEEIEAEEQMTDEEKAQKKSEKTVAKVGEKETKAGEAEANVAAMGEEDPEKQPWWMQLGAANMPDALKEKGAEIIAWLKENIVGAIWGAGKKLLSGMATGAADAATSGGVVSFLKGLGALYGGLTFVLKTLRPAFQSVADQGTIKAEIEEAGGEEEFWEEGTDEAKKDDKGKEEKKNEAFVRQLVREMLLNEEYYSKLPKGHIDGQPWPGTPEDLADAQASTWGHGTVVDRPGYKELVRTGYDFSVGKAQPILKLSEQHLRKLIQSYYKPF